jgi:hypothetical protein
MLAIWAIAIYILRIVEQEEKVPTIRRLEALEHLHEAVGRSIELNTPILYYGGWGRGTIYGTDAPQLMAGLEVMAHVAELTASLGADYITIHSAPELIPMATDLLRFAYTKEGKPEDFDPDMVRFTGGQLSTVPVILGMAEREKIASYIYVGSFWAEALQVLETSHIAGGITIGGTAMYHQIAFFIAAADYTLIGEEIFAAGAYLSKDPVQVGTIWAQDMVRIIGIALTIGVALLATAGSTWLVNLLGM